ncbi:MAG: hypothetical protein KKB81_04305 [Candidatus Margulisbacteria bacterium]|nr:hypothetical protein [Candidatus Margulisiibacteriota bacterium]MBU1021968.1 hypothetical protein [Candidatus Margulisiibacteriota bacterium]MBU1728947.1 hypothetical protein [Candidatus Margulisiibacteriota bacterium]MBU1954753.1 hypothetical protein [Candidatus Margulisiibacteriota bacterium]
MPLEKFAPKKIYYYVICVLAFFVLMWGIIDLTSSSINLLILNPSGQQESSFAPSEGSVEVPIASLKGNPVEDYYQRRMMMDRFGDSLARVLIAGIIFAYARYAIFKLEGGK